MEKFDEYWVEKASNIDSVYVYGIKNVLGMDGVYLLKSPVIKDENFIFLGHVKKNTKRGITVLTFAIETSGTMVFLSRGDYQVLDPGLYDQFLEKDK